MRSRLGLPSSIWILASMLMLGLLASACTPEFNAAQNNALLSPTSSSSPSVTANEAPVASDGDLSINEDQAGSGTLKATDAEGDSLTYTIVSKPKRGTVEISGATFNYTPTRNENGTDSFIFKVSDGQLESNEATVSIIIKAVDDAAVASAISATVVEDTQSNVISLSYTDIESDKATTCTTSSVVGGSVSSCTCSSGNCSAVFTPTEDLSGSGAASFNYTTSANGSTSEAAKVTITITPFCSGMTQTATAPFVTGFSYTPDGTSTKPYRICTQAQLQTVQTTTALWSKYFKLKQDINLTGYTGLIGTLATKFTGTFDGGGHVLSNFTYSNNATPYVGLFGWVQGDGTIDGVADGEIKNLGVTSVTLDGSTYVGAIAGVITQGKISNSYSSGTVQSTVPGDHVGGLVGYMQTSSNVTTSYSSATVTGRDNVGGLIGNLFTSGGTISSSYTTSGSVTGRTNVGGLVGNQATGTTVSASYSKINVTATGDYTGGLIGLSTGTVNQGSYYSDGTVASSGTNATGGLIGYASAATVDDCYSTGATISGAPLYVGGLIGSFSGTISNSYSTNNLTGAFSRVGGLIGRFGGAASTINNSYATGAITSSSSYLGGLVGQMDAGTVIGSYSSGNVTHNGAGGGATYCGGLVGSASNITSSYATGNVDCGPGQRVGGLAGGAAAVTSSYSTGQVTNTAGILGGLLGLASGAVVDSYSTSTVTSTGPQVAGLVAWGSGSILRCYYSGSVTGAGSVGGIAGNNAMSVTDSYSTGTVVSTGNGVGGLVGSHTGTAAITGSYSTANVTGPGSVGGLVGNYNSTGNLTNSYATGDVTATGIYVGGLVAYVGTAITIDGSYATGNVTTTNAGASSAGGLVGRFNLTGPTVQNSYALGNVKSAGSDVGGLIGLLTGTSSVTDSFSTGDVYGAGGVTGGLIGRASAATVTRCYALGNVTANPASGNYSGGLVGYFGTAGGSVLDSYATGNVSGLSYNGGLVGGVGVTFTILRSFAQGKTTGTNYIGGLVGECSTASTCTIEDSFSTGAVTATGNSTGGILGISAGTTNITRSYSISPVEGATYVGGIVGNGGGAFPLTMTQVYYAGMITSAGTKGAIHGYKPSGTATCASCLWDSDLNVGFNDSGTIGDMADAEPKTTAQLQTGATFTAAGWDFVGEAPNGANDYWVMPNAAGYPKLAISNTGGNPVTTGRPVLHFCYGAALTNAPYADGGAAAGTLANPHRICTTTQLTALASTSADWGKYFILGEDLNLTGYTGVIGNATTAFTGTFDARQYSFTNLLLNSAGTSRLGLFGHVNGDGGGDGSGDGWIMNVKLTSPSVTGSSYVSPLVGYLTRGTLISNRVTGGTVSGVTAVGGLVGHVAANGQVWNSRSTAAITASTSQAGGLVGYSAGQVRQSFAKGNVTGGTDAGGVIGSNSGTILDSYSEGATISGTSNIGGVIGGNTSGTVTRVYSASTVQTGSGNRGGLVGQDTSGTYTNTYWDSDLNTTLTDIGDDGDIANVTGQATATMKDSANFSSWGFNWLWKSFTAGTDYPRLSQE